MTFEPSTNCNLALNVVLEIIEGNHVFHAILEVMATSLHVTTDSSSARVAESRVWGCRGQHTLCLVLMLLLKWTEVVEWRWLWPQVPYFLLLQSWCLLPTLRFTKQARLLGRLPDEGWIRQTQAICDTEVLSNWCLVSLILCCLEPFFRFESFLHHRWHCWSLIVSDLSFFFMRVVNRINSSPEKHLLEFLTFLFHFSSELLLLLCNHSDVFIFFVFATWS